MSNPEGSVGIGLLLGWGLNLCQLFVGAMLVDVLMKNEDSIPVAVVAGGIGLIQLVYILPFYFRFRRQEKTATAARLVVCGFIHRASQLRLLVGQVAEERTMNTRAGAGDPMNEISSDRGGILLGFLTGAGLCIIHAVIVLASSDLAVVIHGLRFFGLVQFVYMIPVFLFLQRRRPAMASGLAIAAVLVALANIVLAMME